MGSVHGASGAGVHFFYLTNATHKDDLLFATNYGTYRSNTHNVVVGVATKAVKAQGFQIAERNLAHNLPLRVFKIVSQLESINYLFLRQLSIAQAAQQ
jgi:hypothetical protein